MALPKIKKPAGGRFEGIKSKLGFPSAPKPEDYEEGYDEGYEGDYEEYAAYDNDYGDYDESLANYDPRRPDTTTPPLVSLEDVRASTRFPDNSGRNPAPGRRSSSSPASTAYPSSSGYRPSYIAPRKIERASDYMRSTDTSDLAQGRSAGYDSLFSSTAPAPSGTRPASFQAARPSASAFDPFETFEGSGIATHSPTRSLSVLKPVSYSEVEQVAKAVRAGDAVVLCLRSTPDVLAKRVLDFSFGVSSALDATVDCIADKVFVILKGRPLSEDEYLSLRNQGIIG